MLTVYGYMKCSTCRNAIKWLDATGNGYDFIDITEKPPPQTLLKRALAQGVALHRLFNTSGQQYRQLSIKDKLPDMSQAEAVRLLASNGMLGKRPIVTDGERVTVGFKAEDFAAAWG